MQDSTTFRYTLDEPRVLGDTPLGPVELAQGSYQLSLRLSDALTIAYPLMIGRGEALALDLALPRPESVPEGFDYIPEGRFLFGSPDDELVRRFFSTPPQHVVETGPYLIARLSPRAASRRASAVLPWRQHVGGRGGGHSSFGRGGYLATYDHRGGKDLHGHCGAAAHLYRA